MDTGHTAAQLLHFGLPLLGAVVLVAPETLRLYRKYGLSLAIAVGLCLTAMAFVWTSALRVTLLDAPRGIPLLGPIFVGVFLLIPPLVYRYGQRQFNASIGFFFASLATLLLWYVEFAIVISRTGL